VRQVQRIVGGPQRATLPPVDDVADADSTVAAVDRYVQPLSLDAAGEVIAAAARALAWKLDQVRGSDASASASAAPALARELAAMLDRLSDAAQRAEPSPLDEILRRRDERLAAMRRENEPR
jgi:hypothetical protein